MISLDSKLCLTNYSHLKVKFIIHLYRPRTEYDARLCFHRCLSVNRGRGYPKKVMFWHMSVHLSVHGGRGTPRYLTPLPKYLSSWPGLMGGTPRYLPPKLPTSPGQVQMGGRYLGVPPSPATKVPTPPARSGYLPPNPRYLPPPPPGIGQHMEYLIRRGRYASCVHAGGLSCFWVVHTSAVFRQTVE